MIRAGEYKIGRHNVVVKDLTGSRQAIAIDGVEVMFNENGFAIASEEPEAAPETSATDDRASGVLGSQSRRRP